MNTIAPPLRVHVIWHPNDVRSTTETPVELPQQLFRLLHSDPALLASERSGIPVALHTGGAAPDGTTELPPTVDLSSSARSLVVLLVGDAMCDDDAWVNWVRDLRFRIEDAPTATLLPLALVERALGRTYMLGEVAAERVFDQTTRVERDRGVRIAILRTLVRMLNNDQRTRVFVSHAKADGRRVARVLADYLDELKGESWIDAEQIESGQNFRAVLNQAVDPNSVFVAIVSDAYATREWCRWEAQIAKQKGLAMVVLDMVSEGQRRGVPALANLPVIRFNAHVLAEDAPVSAEAIVACRRVMETVLLERLNTLYFPQRVSALAAHFGEVSENWKYFSPAPDLMSLVRACP